MMDNLSFLPFKIFIRQKLRNFTYLPLLYVETTNYSGPLQKHTALNKLRYWTRVSFKDHHDGTMWVQDLTFNYANL